MTVIRFAVGCDPRGQGRPELARKPFPHMHKAAADTYFEDNLREIAVEVMAGRAPLTGPISLSLRFRLRVPKSASKKLRAAYLSGEQAYLGAYDTSNMVKSVEDAMNKVVFVDDKQITRLWATKVAHERPGIDVRVESFG